MSVNNKKKNAASGQRADTLLDKLVPRVPVCEAETSIFRIGLHGKRVFLTLFGILLVYIIVWFATLIRNNLQEFDYIGYAERQERVITVSASDKVTVKPDVARTSIGMISHAETVAKAQEENTKVMNALIDRVKQLGISADDIKTQNYNVYPRYRYTDKEGQIQDGYDVSQSVQITFRGAALDLSSKVIALAGELGANSVSGLSFTIDDPEVYREQARNKAIAEARAKAVRLADALGVRLRSIVDYNEYVGSDTIMSYKGYAESMGIGGGAPAPDIQEGSNEVEVSVNITYEIF